MAAGVAENKKGATTLAAPFLLVYAELALSPV